MKIIIRTENNFSPITVEMEMKEIMLSLYFFFNE